VSDRACGINSSELDPRLPYRARRSASCCALRLAPMSQPAEVRTEPRSPHPRNERRPALIAGARPWRLSLPHSFAFGLLPLPSAVVAERPSVRPDLDRIRRASDAAESHVVRL